MFLVVCSRRRSNLIYAATVCFVLAVYTKQTLIAAPASQFAMLLIVRPRLAWKGIAFGALLAAVLLGGLEWWTDGRFVRHIIVYNINPRDVLHGLALIWEQRWEFLFPLLAMLSVATGWLQILHEAGGFRWRAIQTQLLENESTFIFATFSLYFLFSFTMLLMLFKEGSAENYFVEAMSVWSVLVGQLLNASFEWAAVSPPATRWWLRFAPHVVLGLVVVQAILIPLPPTRTLTSAETAAGMAELLKRVRAADKPVLSDDMVTLLRGGKQVPIEPAIFSSLTRTGIWKEAPLIDIIKSHGFEFIVTANGGLPGHSVYATRYTKQARQAIELAYPHTMSINDLFTVHLP
jgi:hypothetical protein